MKKSFTLLSVVLIGIVFCVNINAQHNPFSVKRTPVPGQIASPHQVKAISNNQSFNQGSRSVSLPSYRPAQLNISSLFLDRGFTSHKFDQYGQLIFLEGEGPNTILLDSRSDASIATACFEYLKAIKTALKIEDPQQEFRLKSTETDDLGMHHMKMQQVYKDIPVWCAEIYLHSRQDKIELFNGHCYPTPLISVTPVITKAKATELTIGDIQGHTVYRELTSDEKEILGYTEPLCELVIYHHDRNPLHPELSWHVSIRPNMIEQWEYFIDANSGEIIHYYNNTRSDGDVPANGIDLNGVNQSFHVYLENSVYLMVDISRPMYNPQTYEGVLSVLDAENTNPYNEDFKASLVTSSNNTWSPTAVSAMYNAQKAYEYFRTVHNKNSYNDQGASIKSIIHMSSKDGGGYDNAFWNGMAIFYGDGAAKFKPLAGGLDVGAHEVGHAYEGAASNLEYQGQSGAVAESYADFSGAMVERQNWTIGEQIVKGDIFPTGCLRNMADPHNGGTSLDDPGYQPANVSEMYTGSEDNGGVHINSGLGNNAFYRTAEAIGKEKTEKIFWRACFNYNTRSTQFIDFRLNTLQAAKDLFGDNSTEKNAVAVAFDAVGITEGQGGNYQTQLQVNPGQDYILFYDLIPNDPNSLYISSTSGSDFLAISQTDVNNKPSIVDDGSIALFISTDNKMRSIELSQTPNETIIQDEAVWHNVAVAKDGTKLSAITIFQDSSIWVYSFQLQQWATFHLYNSTTAQGEVTNTVIFADAMEWDYSGEYIMYDAFSRIENPDGDPIEYWDINFIKVWDNSTSSWGSGEILKLFGNLPAGISVGNPSFSKNSPFVFAFDLLDESTNTVTVGAANFETGDIVEIFGNGSVLGTPNYSKLDDQIIFTVPDGTDNTIAIIDMQPDKITPSSTDAYALITQAKWGIWFAQGTRPLLGLPEPNTEFAINLYPNPTSGKVTLTFDPAPADKVLIKVFDSHGTCITTYPPFRDSQYVFDLTGLPAGLYFISVTGKNTVISKKILIQ